MSKGLLLPAGVLLAMAGTAISNNWPSETPPPSVPIAYGSRAPAKSAAPEAAPPVTCKADWRKCTDNADLANHYDRYLSLQSDCERAATKQAKYGTPKFPGFWSGGSFASFRTGNDTVRTGVVRLIEPDAQFSNGFGAMVHSRVVCTYDLNSNTVTDVTIFPN